MKDCERCKNVAICKLEKTRDKCAFVNPFEEIPIIHGKAELEEHDKQIRNKAIDEFAERIIELDAEFPTVEDDFGEYRPMTIKEMCSVIAEQMKGEH